MNFLADEGVDRQIVERLRQSNYDVLTVMRGCTQSQQGFNPTNHASNNYMERGRAGELYFTD